MGIRFGPLLRGLASFALLVVLHYTLRPLLGWRAPMDFLLIALLLISVRVRPGMAAVIGFAIGFVADSLTPAALGAGAVAMTLVGYGASWLKAVFFADNLALNAFFLFVGKWIFDIIVVLAARRIVGTELAMQIFVWSPLAAAFTAVAGAIVLTMLRPIMELRPTA